MTTESDKVCINCDNCDVIENGNENHLVCVLDRSFHRVIEPTWTCPLFKESIFSGMLFFEIDDK